MEPIKEELEIVKKAPQDKEKIQEEEKIPISN